MLNILSQLDTNLFFLINHFPHNFLLDYFFGVLSFVGEYGAIWFLLAFLLFLKNQLRKVRPCEAKFGIEAKKLAVVWGTEIFSLLLVFFLKEIFQRLRPEFVLQNVILPFGPNSSFSFPSGHATLSFAMAYLLTRFRRCERIPPLGCERKYLFLAVLIAFSRVYLGYHYPGDVISGAILGTLIGVMSLNLFRRCCWLDKNNSDTVVR